MSFSWPWALTALLAVPLLLAIRWWLNRRRKRSAITVSSVALIRAALPGRTSWRRRIPVFLFLAGLLSLGFAPARPNASVSVPSNSTSVLLAIDVSGSMCSTDVQPNRFTVATDAIDLRLTTRKEPVELTALFAAAALLLLAAGALLGLRWHGRIV